MFVDEAGTEYHPHRFTKMFEVAVKRAGVPRSGSTTRATKMATLALEAGVHPKAVQEQLGENDGLACPTSGVSRRSELAPPVGEFG